MKINLLKISPYLLGISLVAILFGACQKSNTSSNQLSRLNIHLTDGPADYQAVLINIQKIMIKSSDNDSDAGWVDVPLLKPGMYDLLQLRNGKDTLLGGVDWPAGKLSQIRLVLGDGNQLVLDDGTVVDLKTPSAQQSGLKLKLDATLRAGMPYDLVLDFDAARSIVKAGNSGQYILKPVIRAFAKASGGAIQGVVLPDSAKAHIMAISGTDTLGALPDASGFYKIPGLPSGSYTLIFNPDSATTYQSATLQNISVTTGNVTTVDTLRLTHR
jgi:hypothetical protein